MSRVAAEVAAHGSRVLRFAAVGGSGVVLNNVVLYLLVEKARWSPLPASAVATELSIISNFMLNDIWTFADSPRTRRRLLRLLTYNTLTLGGLLISVTVLAILTYVAGAHYLLANLFAIGAGTAWNYATNRRWTWSLTWTAAVSRPSAKHADTDDTTACHRHSGQAAALRTEVAQTDGRSRA